MWASSVRLDAPEREMTTSAAAYAVAMAEQNSMTCTWGMSAVSWLTRAKSAEPVMMRKSHKSAHCRAASMTSEFRFLAPWEPPITRATRRSRGRWSSALDSFLSFLATISWRTGVPVTMHLAGLK